MKLPVYPTKSQVIKYEIMPFLLYLPMRVTPEELFDRCFQWVDDGSQAGYTETTPLHSQWVRKYLPTGALNNGHHNDDHNHSSPLARDR